MQDKTNKILFLTWKDIRHPHKWWAEKVMHQYMKRLVQKWYDITRFAYEFSWCKKNETIDGIKIIRKFTLKSSFFLFPNYYRKHFAGKFDLIIDEAWGLPFLSPNYIKDTPIILFVHHIWEKERDFSFPWPINNIWRRIYKSMFKMYKNQQIITVSESSKQDLIKLWLPNKSINIIENTIDIIDEKVNLKKEDKILFLWRLMPIKRVEDAIKAFDIFHKNNKSYSLTIIWNDQDKKYVAKLKKLVSKLWINSQVNFLWYLADEEFDTVLWSHKVMLVPSYKEWYWLIVVEWNSYWIPVIGYDVWGLKDSIKDGVNGILIKDGNRKAMWKKLDELINDKTWYDKMSKQSYKYVKSIPSWDNQTDKFEEIIDNILVW